MGFNDFWINNNGKKEHLNNAKHGVRKEQVEKKFHNLFDAYDANGDGTLENEELGGVFKGLTKFAGADKTLDAAENKQVASLFANQAGIEDADFMGFVRSVSKATEDIVDSKTTPTADGGREVTTTYKDGSVETISYYPDGEYKFKKLDQKATTTTNFYTIGNDVNKKYTAAEIESRVKKAYNQRVAQVKANAEKNKPVEGKATYIIPNYDQFKQEYMQRNKIYQGSDTKNFERHDFELSERGKQDVAVRDFVLNHYVETHKAAQEALESMGILDDVGAAINAGAGELWNSIKNVWNGTEEEYQNFYELSKKFEPNYNKALRTDGSLDVMRNNPEMFFRSFETDFKKDTGHKFDLQTASEFQETTERYQNATILNQRLDILKDAMSEIRSYQSEQDALVHAPAQNEGLNPASHIVKANKLLLQYFNNDQEAVDMILNGTIGNAEATIKAISGIKEETETQMKNIIGDRSYDDMKKEYETQYKAMYGTDFVPDELTDKVMDAKATGGMVKLAAITIVSILVTRSPIMAEISGAAAGSAEATGAAANLVRTLVAKYGQTAVQQGIKLAMTSGTLATDVGLTLINQATSERGVNGEELWESTKGSAKYIFFGAYVGAPMAQAVSKSLGKIGATSRLFEGGTKTANGAIQTTSISGDKLIQNFVKGGNKVLTTGGAFLTDVAAFTGLEVATEGANLKDALSEQGQMLSKLKLMNHVLEYMLGAKAHTATSRANLDAAIEKSGVKNWNIKEIKTPQKTQYIVDIDGLPVGKFEDANQLATAMLERVTANYSGNDIGNQEGVKTNKGPDKVDLKIKNKFDYPEDDNETVTKSTNATLDNETITKSFKSVAGMDAKFSDKVKSVVSKTTKKFHESEHSFVKAKQVGSETVKPEYKTFEIAEATDLELEQIQKIDIGAFEGRYEISSDFETYKADLTKQEIKTYAIKAEDGSVVGYYQLEPVENGELYIHSIGVRADLRNTRASYNALKQMQENITKFAKENNVEKVTLDVDANKPELVKLYKKFGFEVTSENRGVEAGQEYHDLHMEADVKKVLGEKTENTENKPTAQKDRHILVITWHENISRDNIERMQSMSKRPANNENDVEFMLNSFDTKEFSWDQDPTKLFVGTIFRVDDQPEGYLLHKKLGRSTDAKTGTELFVSINPNSDKATIGAVKAELSQKLNRLIQQERIKDITVKVDPSNKTLIEFLEQEGFSKTGIEEGYFADGSSADIYKIGNAQLRNIDNHFRETGKTELFTSDEQKDIIYEKCGEFNYDFDYDKILAQFENAKNRNLFTRENIAKLEELANKYNLNVQDILRDRIDVLSSADSMTEIEEIFKIRSQINVYRTGSYTKEAAEAQVEFLKYKDELTSIISNDNAVEAVISHIKDKSQLEGILYVLRNKDLTDRIAGIEDGEATYKFLHTLSEIKSLDDATAKVDFINKMAERFGNEDKTLSEILDITYNGNLFNKFSAKEAEKMISTVVDKFKDGNLNVKQLHDLCYLISDGSYDQVVRILDSFSKPEVDGLNAFEAMFMTSGNTPSPDWRGRVLDIFEEFDGMNVGSIKPDKLREKVWYAAQSRPQQYIETLKELRANKNIPDNLKLFCHMLDEEHPERIYEQLSTYPKEKVDAFIESKLMNYVYEQNLDLINTDINTDIVKKYNLTRYIDYFNDNTVNIINSLDDAKLQKIKDIGLLKKVYRLEDLNEFNVLEDAAFDRISERNLLSMKVHKYDTDGLSARQIREAANLTDIEWQRSLGLPENTPFNTRLQLAKLDEVQYNELKNAAEYLKNNKKLLQQADMPELTDQQINALLMSEGNLSGSVEILRIAGADVLKHAAELRYKGYNEFIKNGIGLAKLPNDLRQVLIERISKLPHPEQKIEKLQMIASITSVTKPEVIESLINDIIPPTMTREQKLKTDAIFSTDKPYEEQVEDFIKQFNVSPNRQKVIRDYLLGAKLNEKFVTPPSAEEQIAIINKKIQSINSNDKIPEDKKQSYLALLNKQIEDIRSNPEEYTRPRINDRAIKPLEQRVEAYVNLPNLQREFNSKLNNILYETIGVDATPQLLDAFEYDNKYFARLFNAGNANFRTNFQRLLELVKLNPNRKFTDLVKELPENIETKRLFEENGLDFDRWTRFDEQFNQPFTVKVDVEKSVQSARTNLLDEFTSELAKRLDATELAKLNQILQDNNIDTAGQKDLPKIIKIIEKELETNEYWKNNSPDIKTFKDHIQIHKKNIHEVEQLKDTTEELYVRLWDNDNVGRNIFFGNHVGCCTSVGSGNSFAAPQHLMNSFVNGIEIVDKSGNSMGNSMCYFAKVDDKITFVIDSFEANGKLGAAPEVTNAVIEYAKKVCAEMGVPDANIMFGPNYNKIDFSRCIKTGGHKIEIIGRAPDATYIDCIGGHGNINSVCTGRPMHEIMDL